jgi:hypothetical protein
MRRCATTTARQSARDLLASGTLRGNWLRGTLRLSKLEQAVVTVVLLQEEIGPFQRPSRSCSASPLEGGSVQRLVLPEVALIA